MKRLILAAIALFAMPSASEACHARAAFVTATKTVVKQRVKVRRVPVAVVPVQMKPATVLVNRVTAPAVPFRIFNRTKTFVGGYGIFR